MVLAFFCCRLKCQIFKRAFKKVGSNKIKESIDTELFKVVLIYAKQFFSFQ
jgi:hypothetical protein